MCHNCDRLVIFDDVWVEDQYHGRQYSLKMPTQEKKEQEKKIIIEVGDQQLSLIKKKGRLCDHLRLD